MAELSCTCDYGRATGDPPARDPQCPQHGVTRLLTIHAPQDSARLVAEVVLAVDEVCTRHGLSTFAESDHGDLLLTIRETP